MLGSLSFLFYSCVRTLTKNHFRKALIYLTFRLLSIMKWRQGRNPGRNEKAGSEAEAMVKHCLLACSTFLTPLQTTSPGMALLTIAWTIPQRGFMKKMLHRLAYRPMWLWHFSQLMFLLPSLPYLLSSWKQTKLNRKPAPSVSYAHDHTIFWGECWGSQLRSLHFLSRHHTDSIS